MHRLGHEEPGEEQGDDGMEEGSQRRLGGTDACDDQHHRNDEGCDEERHRLRHPHHHHEAEQPEDDAGVLRRPAGRLERPGRLVPAEDGDGLDPVVREDDGEPDIRRPGPQRRVALGEPEVGIDGGAARQPRGQLDAGLDPAQVAADLERCLVAECRRSLETPPAIGHDDRRLALRPVPRGERTEGACGDGRHDEGDHATADRWRSAGACALVGGARPGISLIGLSAVHECGPPHPMVGERAGAG